MAAIGTYRGDSQPIKQFGEKTVFIGGYIFFGHGFIGSKFKSSDEELNRII
jgi:hypothetical protein